MFILGCLDMAFSRRNPETVGPSSPLRCPMVLGKDRPVSRLTMSTSLAGSELLLFSRRPFRVSRTETPQEPALPHMELADACWLYVSPSLRLPHNPSILYPALPTMSLKPTNTEPRHTIVMSMTGDGYYFCLNSYDCQLHTNHYQLHISLSKIRNVNIFNSVKPMYNTYSKFIYNLYINLPCTTFVILPNNPNFNLPYYLKNITYLDCWRCHGDGMLTSSPYCPVDDTSFF